jgi:Nickel responsive protein SCO4226-like
MLRFLIERRFDQMSEDEMAALVARSQKIAAERFPDVIWEHSHVVSGDDGHVWSFCVYGAPTALRVREHADAFGGHHVVRVFEIIGDIEPDDVIVDT